MNRRYRGSHHAVVRARRRQKRWAERMRFLKIVAAVNELIHAFSDLFRSWVPVFERITKGMQNEAVP